MFTVKELQFNGMTNALRYIAEPTSTMYISEQSGILKMEFEYSRGGITLHVQEPLMSDLICRVYHAFDELTIVKNGGKRYQFRDLYDESVGTVKRVGERLDEALNFYKDQFIKQPLLLERDNYTSSSYYQIISEDTNYIEAVIFDDRDFAIIGGHFFQLTPRLHGELKGVLDSIYYCLGDEDD